MVKQKKFPMKQRTPQQPLPPVKNEPASARYVMLLKLTCWIFVIFMILKMGVYRPFSDHGVDYPKHWLAARVLFEGGNPYIGQELWLGFNYPQATAFAYFWLGFVDMQTGEKLFKGWMGVLLFSCWLMAWKYYRPRDVSMAVLSPVLRRVHQACLDNWGLLTALAVCFYFPAWHALYLGNVDPTNAFLSMAMITFLIMGRDRPAGVAWALLSLVKMMPVFLIIPILIHRRWRMLQSFMLVMIIYFFVLLATGRLGYEWFFVKVSMPEIPFAWRDISMTPIRFILRALGLEESLYHDRHYYGLLTHASTIFFLACIGSLALWLHRRREDWLNVVEVTMLFIPVVSPLMEYYHFVWIMPAFLLQLRRWVAGQMRLSIGLWLLFGWFNLFFLSYHVQDLGLGVFSKWVQAAPLFGYFIILIASVLQFVYPARPREKIAEERDAVQA